MAFNFNDWADRLHRDHFDGMSFKGKDGRTVTADELVTAMKNLSPDDRSTLFHTLEGMAATCGPIVPHLETLAKAL